eukprot:scpid92767/ scgid3906/ 
MQSCRNIMILNNLCTYLGFICEVLSTAKRAVHLRFVMVDANYTWLPPVATWANSGSSNKLACPKAVGWDFFSGLRNVLPLGFGVKIHHNKATVLFHIAKVDSKTLDTVSSHSNDRRRSRVAFGQFSKPSNKRKTSQWPHCTSFVTSGLL